MREIKVQCDCGQRYKFEVEPVNGQMPYTIACPLCGLDGTANANQLLRQPPTPSPLAVAPAPVAPTPSTPVPGAPVHLAPVIPAAGPIVLQSVGASAPAPVPVAPSLTVSSSETAAPPPAPVAPAPVAPAERPRLRITRHSEPDASAPPPPPPPSSIAAHSPAPGRAFGSVKAAAQAETQVQTNLLLGTIGGVVAGAIGLGIWYGLSQVGIYSGWVAWGVGILVGIGARVLGRVGSPVLGAIAAVCALIAIFGGEYMWAVGEVKAYETEIQAIRAEITKTPEQRYDEQLQIAKDAVAAKSDQELAAVIKKYGEYEEEPNAFAIKIFKETALPELRDFANGIPSKEEFISQIKAEIEEEEDLIDSITPWGVLMDEIVWLLIILGLGVTSAFKICAGS